MEILTSVWVIFMIYCTNWLGIQQCFAVPLPTLTNYHGYYSKNSWNNKNSRYPETKYEKFVFPSKQQETIAFVENRSGFQDDSSGKIFFPDEIPIQPINKHSSEREVLPVWEQRRRPSTAFSSSRKEWQYMDQMESKQSSQDGSIRMPSTKTQQLDVSNPTLETSERSSNLKSSALLEATSSDSKLSEEERVQEAVQEFYKWLKLTRGRQKNQQKETMLCSDKNPTGSKNMDSTKPNINQDPTKPGSFISDQSLVAGLKDQKCPEGQIRLENGECRIKLVI